MNYNDNTLSPYPLRPFEMSQEGTSSSQATATPDDDWSSVTDPNERRKIQNRIAQRKFREKVRQQREDCERTAENQRRAGGAYSTPEPEDIEAEEEEGLPWGSLSLRHVISAGRTKEQSSRETSLYAAASKAGGSSRLGLHLIDNYARGSPAWTAWRSMFPTFSFPPFGDTQPLWHPQSYEPG